MNWHVIGVGMAWLAAGFVFGSFMEYWGHRFIHTIRWGPGKTHREHHARGTAQGVMLEFWDYFKFSWLLMWPPFLLSLPAGIGWVLGANGFILFSAFAHQLQHEMPRKCFWMRMPIHHVHHAHNQWHHNFGMALDIWDRIFGTYKPTPWDEPPHAQAVEPTRRCWQINWLWGGNANAELRMEAERKLKADSRKQPAES